VLSLKAFAPNALFDVPVVFDTRAYPKALFWLPVVFAFNAKYPNAAPYEPVVFAAKALPPTAVLVDIALPPLPTVRPDIEASTGAEIAPVSLTVTNEF
jgi:hypothetical protein